MSDQIYDNMIAWKDTAPWHNKGFKVDPESTGQEMLKVAKLDFPVVLRALAMDNGSGIWIPTGLEKCAAVVRGDTGQVFQLASMGYKPVQNEEIVNFFQEYCQAGKATMDVVGGIGGGRIVWALAKLGKGANVNLGGVDKMKGYIVLATSHDGTLRTIGKATSIRVVCNNTLMAAIGEKAKAEFRMKHSRKWTPEVAAEAKKILGLALEQVQQLHEVAEKLSKVSIDDQGRLEFVHRLLNKGESVLEQIVNDAAPKSGADVLKAAMEQDEEKGDKLTRVGKAILEAMMHSPGADFVTAHNTMWGALNGFTYWADHSRGRTQDKRLERSLFDTDGQMKARAIDVAMQMSGVSAN